MEVGTTHAARYPTDKIYYVLAVACTADDNDTVQLSGACGGGNGDLVVQIVRVHLFRSATVMMIYTRIIPAYDTNAYYCTRAFNIFICFIIHAYTYLYSHYI